MQRIILSFTLYKKEYVFLWHRANQGSTLNPRMQIRPNIWDEFLKSGAGEFFRKFGIYDTLKLLAKQSPIEAPLAHEGYESI